MGVIPNLPILRRAGKPALRRERAALHHLKFRRQTEWTGRQSAPTEPSKAHDTEAIQIGTSPWQFVCGGSRLGADFVERVGHFRPICQVSASSARSTACWMRPTAPRPSVTGDGAGTGSRRAEL